MKRSIQFLVVSVIIIGLSLFLSACPRNEPPAEPTAREGQPVIKLTSPAFKEGEAIPAKYAYAEANVSPPLAWTNLLSGTKSLALICDDPDAPRGIWVHWVIYNIPANTTELPEGVPVTATLTSGARQGLNDSKHNGYDGPAPPSGTHHYYFKLYALDTTLDLAPGATKEDLLKAMTGHILGQGQLMGTYQRVK